MKHTMIEYIKDQPRALRHTYNNREKVTNEINELFSAKNIKKIYFLGSGTSYHASLIAKKYFEKYLDVEAVASIPTAFTYYENINNNGIYKKDEILVVAISQTGSSISTINALKKAKEEGYLTLALTEALGSSITKYADTVSHLLCGKEEIPPETRGYTVTLLTVYLWAVTLGFRLIKKSEEKYNELILEAEKVITAVPYVLEDSEKWYARNKYELLMMQKADIAGYGLNYATALEGSLKIGETLRRKVSGVELEELLHGPEMGYDLNNYLFIIASREAEFDRMIDSRRYLKGLTSHVFTITAEDIDVTDKDLKLDVKSAGDLSPIIFAVPFQVMSALSCRDIGIDTSIYPHSGHGMSHEYPEK
ncbi:MAG: SIS domain-containing protein [Bacillota bacterium]|nr:SIS domain-containing protein [Bacillota bacterium]